MTAQTSPGLSEPRIDPLHRRPGDLTYLVIGYLLSWVMTCVGAGLVRDSETVLSVAAGGAVGLTLSAVALIACLARTVLLGQLPPSQWPGEA